MTTKVYTSVMKRTTIFLTEKDKEALAKIREDYGLRTDTAAIRFAIQVIAKYGVTAKQDT